MLLLYIRSQAAFMIKNILWELSSTNSRTDNLPNNLVSMSKHYAVIAGTYILNLKLQYHHVDILVIALLSE